MRRDACRARKLTAALAGALSAIAAFPPVGLAQAIDPGVPLQVSVLPRDAGSPLQEREYRVGSLGQDESVRVVVTRGGQQIATAAGGAESSGHLGEMTGEFGLVDCQPSLFTIEARSEQFPLRVATTTLNLQAPCSGRVKVKKDVISGDRALEDLILNVQDGWVRRSRFTLCTTPPSETETCEDYETNSQGLATVEAPLAFAAGRYRVSVKLADAPIVRRSYTILRAVGGEPQAARAPQRRAFSKRSATSATRGLARRRYVADPSARSYGATCAGSMRSRRFRCDAWLGKRTVNGENYRCLYPVIVTSTRRGRATARFAESAPAQTDSPVPNPDC